MRVAVHRQEDLKTERHGKQGDDPSLPGDGVVNPASFLKPWTFHAGLPLSVRDFDRQSAEATLARMKLMDRRLEINPLKVGPQAFGENELGVGDFPEQKIAQALLSASADQKVDLG